jgi:hypothetical protein
VQSHTRQHFLFRLYAYDSNWRRVCRGCSTCTHSQRWAWRPVKQFMPTTSMSRSLLQRACSLLCTFVLTCSLTEVHVFWNGLARLACQSPLACRRVQEFAPLLRVLFLRDPKPRDIGSLDMLTAGKRNCTQKVILSKLMAVYTCMNQNQSKFKIAHITAWQANIDHPRVLQRKHTFV